LATTLLTRVSHALPPFAIAARLPVCASPACPKPPTLWQRWWARNEGIHLEGQWFCSAECFAAGLRIKLESVLWPGEPVDVPRNRLPLGLILLDQGFISQEQLQEGLRNQRSAGKGRIGEWLLRAGAVTPQQVMGALAIQQNCPLFEIKEPQHFPSNMRFPTLLVRSHGGIPVCFNPARNCLYMGFHAPVSHALLRAVEHIMRCQAQPCIVSDQLHSEAQLRWDAEGRGEAICIEQELQLTEISSAIGGYAEQTGALSCAVVRCSGYLWARLYGEKRTLDLLFGLGSRQTLSHEFPPNWAVLRSLHPAH